MVKPATKQGSPRVWLCLLANTLLLALAAGLWAWAEYRYLKLYRPPEELREMTQGIVYGLPVIAVALNLLLLRRLCLWRQLVWALVAALLVNAAWWTLFQTVGVRWHLALGGSLH